MAQSVALGDLATPALLLDKAVLERNANTMLKRAAELGVSLRPNVKTHKSVQLAELQHTGRLVLHSSSTDRSGMRVVTSTLSETRLMLEEGFGDVLYAVPLAGEAKVRLAREMMRKHGERMAVMVDSEEGIEGLRGAEMWSVFVKVDCGYGRAGRAGEALQRVVRAAEAAGWVRVRGFYTHAGHSYHIGAEDKQQHGSLEQQAASEARAMLQVATAGKVEISIGATPTASRPASREE